jgi:hypothetical protein
VWSADPSAGGDVIDPEIVFVHVIDAVHQLPQGARPFLTVRLTGPKINNVQSVGLGQTRVVMDLELAH